MWARPQDGHNIGIWDGMIWSECNHWGTRSAVTGSATSRTPGCRPPGRARTCVARGAFYTTGWFWTVIVVVVAAAAGGIAAAAILSDSNGSVGNGDPEVASGSINVPAIPGGE